MKESLLIFNQLKIQDSWIQNWGFDLINFILFRSLKKFLKTCELLISFYLNLKNL